MYQMAEREKYEEMAKALQEYVSKIDEQLEIMSKAADDCVDNTGGDAAAAISAENLSKSLSAFNEPIERIREVIQYLLQQIQRIEEAAAEANYID